MIYKIYSKQHHICLNVIGLQGIFVQTQFSIYNLSNIIFSEHEIGILEKVLTLLCSKENQWIQVKKRFPRVL